MTTPLAVPISNGAVVGAAAHDPSGLLVNPLQDSVFCGTGNGCAAAASIKTSPETKATIILANDIAQSFHYVTARKRNRELKSVCSHQAGGSRPGG